MMDGVIFRHTLGADCMTFDHQLTLKSERMVLRPFGPDDAGQVRAVIEAGDVFLPPGAPGHVSGVYQWLAHGVHELRRSGQGVHLAMVADGVLVGAISLFKTLWGAATTEVGYGVHPAHRDRGYATEAVRCLTLWALGEGGLRRVELRANLDNGASLRVAEKSGFAREGLLRGAGLENDGIHDIVVFGLLRGDPPTPRTGFGTGTRLESERLILRPFTTGDAEDVFDAVDGDFEINRWMPWARGYTREHALEWCARFAHADPAGGAQFALEPLRRGRLAGSIGVHRADWERGTAEVGYWIAPWARRLGYATEATRAVTGHLLHRGFHRIELLAAVANLASQAVARKAGFTEEGVLRQALPLPGGYADALLFSLVYAETHS
jgi:RimJ/RimL family protein N-acetyltransferase